METEGGKSVMDHFLVRIVITLAYSSQNLGRKFWRTSGFGRVNGKFIRFTVQITVRKPILGWDS